MLKETFTPGIRILWLALTALCLFYSVIVLGAQMRFSGPSVIYRYRLEKAKEYMDDNADTRCVTTGAQGNNEPVSEGQGGADYLVRLGISEDRVEVETQSMDTEENIKNALKIIEHNEGSVSNLRIGILMKFFKTFLRAIYYTGVHEYRTE